MSRVGPRRSANRSIGVMVGYVVLITAGSVFAQDWPQWRGPNRDGKVAGFTTPETWPEALVEKWKATVGSGDATPALVGGKLYVFARQGEEEVSLCLDANDGKETWQNKYPAQAVTGAASRHPGPRSSAGDTLAQYSYLGLGRLPLPLRPPGSLLPAMGLQPGHDRLRQEVRLHGRYAEGCGRPYRSLRE